jgi:hypothetical protein
MAGSVRIPVKGSVSLAVFLGFAHVTCLLINVNEVNSRDELSFRKTCMMHRGSTAVVEARVGFDASRYCRQ